MKTNLKTIVHRESDNAIHLLLSLSILSQDLLDCINQCESHVQIFNKVEVLCQNIREMADLSNQALGGLTRTTDALMVSLKEGEPKEKISIQSIGLCDQLNTILCSLQGRVESNSKNGSVCIDFSDANSKMLLTSFIEMKLQRECGPHSYKDLSDIDIVHDYRVSLNSMKKIMGVTATPTNYVPRQKTIDNVMGGLSILIMLEDRTVILTAKTMMDIFVDYHEKHKLLYSTIPLKSE